jgi:hypothetical protein
MRKRMLPLLGGLLVVAAIAIAPTAASAGDPQCNNDHYGPSSHWGNDWYGHDGHGSYWRGWGDGNGYFDGTSYDGYCNASDRLGSVDRVMVGVQRMQGSQCRNLRRSERFGPSRDCSDVHWMHARGKRHWRHSISSRLPAGKYRLHHRAFDAAGNHGKHRTRQLVIR